MQNEYVFSDDELYPEERRPSPKQVGILYSIIVFLLLTLGFWAQKQEFYSGVFITEYVIVLAPAIIFLLLFKYDVKKVLRLNRVSIINIFLIFCIMAFAIPLAGVFNLINLWLVNTLFGRIVVAQPPAANDFSSLAMNVFFIGISPAICEETIFRGIIQRSFERLGTKKSIIISAMLFALVHLDFQKLFGTFFLGALIGFIVYRTNSLFGGMFAHFTNNSVAVVAAYALNRLSEFLKSPGMEGINESFREEQIFSVFENMHPVQFVMFIVGWGFIIMLCTSALIGLTAAFIKTTSKSVVRNTARESIYAGSLNIPWFLPGLVLIAVRYIQQGLLLLGIKPY